MNYTHYGNAGIPFALVKEYNSYAAMVADFKSGELCTDVRYGEYVIISNDDPENIDFIHNGSIYRRGYNYWDEETGGAIFISNISESQNKVTQEAIEATKEAQSATKEMNDLYSEVKTSETDRVEKEAARVKAENIRSFAEQQRQSNEVNRQQTIATWDEAIDDLPSYHKRMYNLEDNTLEKEVVASDSMINEVPAEKMTYCSIEEIGGMSHKSENLIPFPYAEMTKTVNGITFTANEDGSITFSGKLTGNAAETNFFLTSPNTPLTFPNGVYTISQKLTTSDIHVLFALVNKITGDTTYHVAGTFELTDDLGLWVCVQPDGSASNVSGTIYPMLNRGETALPYEPYFKGLRDTKVTEVESNSINMCNLARIPDTLNGLTFAKNTNGSVTINGTCTAYTAIYFNKINIKKGEKFYFLGGQSGTTFTFNGNMGGTFIKNIGVADDTIVQVRECDGTYDNFYPILLILEGTVLSNVTVRFMASKTPFTSFSPHFKNTFKIPEAVQNLDGYGQGINEEYYNKIILDPKNNIKKFVQKTKRVVLTGTESCPRVGGKQFAINIADMIGSAYTVNDAICTHYDYRIDSYGNHVRGFVTNNGQLIIRELTLTEDNSVAFQSYLAEQYANGTPVIVEYILATPIETDLSTYFTDDNMLKTEEGGTLTFVNEYSYDVLNKVAYYETTLLNNEDILNERGNRLDKTISQDLFTNTIVNQEIDIEINNKNIQNNIEALNDNLIYSEIDEGDEYIKDIPDDILPYAGITEIGGMTYKSNNLLDMTKFATQHITVTENSDGSFTFTNIHPGAAASAGQGLTGKLPAGTYTLTNYSAKNFFLLFRSGDYSINLTNGESHTFTYDGESMLYTIFSDFQFKETAIVKVMLNRGETALPYEPYFEGLRDTKVTEVESVGVNLFDIEKRSNGSINSNGDLRLPTGIYEFYKYQFKENTRYTISGYMKNDSRLGNLRLTFVYTDGIMNKYILANNTTEWVYLTATSEEGKTLAYIGTYYGDSGEMFIKGGELMINEGTEAKPYSPYYKNTFPIPETVQNMDGYGQGVNEQYYNKIVLDPASGVKKFVKNSNTDTFNGTENTTDFFDTISMFRITLSEGSYQLVHGHGNEGICNLYDVYTGTSYANCPDKSLMIAPLTITTNNRLVFIKDSRFTTVEEFKAFLTNNPLQITYRLVTPTETDISAYFTDDNLIGIEANGTITAINEYNYDVPFTVEYKKKKENVSIENITHELGEEEKKVPSQKLFTNTARDLDDRVTQNRIDIEVNNKRLQNLEAALIGDTIEPVIDDTVAYVKDVPSNTLPYASINEIGGMNYKCENLLSMSVLDNKTISGVTFTKNADGTYTANGTATEYIQVYFGAAAVDNTQKIWLSGGAHHVQITVNAMLGSTFVQNIGTAQGGTIQLSQNLNYDRIEFYLVMAPGVTCANVTFYGMANKGETALPYQPYFAGLRDSKVTALESVGACLMSAYTAYNGVNAYAEMVVDGRNCIRMSSGVTFKTAPIVFKENTQYTVSFDTKPDNYGGATTGNNVFTFFYTDGTRTRLDSPKESSAFKRYTITSEAGKTVKEIGVYVAQYLVYNYIDIDSFRFVEGTEIPADCKPYFKNTFEIPEAVQNLDGYGQGMNAQYYNKIVLDPTSGVKKFIRHAWKAILDGSIGSMSAEYANTFMVKVLNVSGVEVCTEGISNVPIISHPNKIGVDDGVYVGFTNTFYITDSRFTNDATAKAILAANPVHIVFIPRSGSTETDVSAYFTDDNLIGVEAGGTITVVNEHEHDMPTIFEYLTKGATT